MGELNALSYPITIDLVQETYQCIDVMQGNKDSITLNVYVTENGNPIQLINNGYVTYRLESSRPDTEKSPVQKDFSSVSGNVITFNCIDEYITSYPGQIYCVIAMYNSQTDRVLKFPYGFYINIIDSPFNEDGVIHSDEFSTLSKLLLKFNGEYDKIMDTEEQIKANETARQTEWTELKTDINTTNTTMNANESARQTEWNELKADITSTDNLMNESEEIRKQNENTRISNETTRVSNENTRITNENTRQTNETDRQNNTGTAITNCDEATERANAAALACENIVVDKIGISNTIIDDTHAFSNKHVDETYLTSELDESVTIVGITPVIDPVIQSAIDDMQADIDTRLTSEEEAITIVGDEPVLNPIVKTAIDEKLSSEFLMEIN